MRLLSVNVGREAPIEGAGKSGRTGIFKRPVGGLATITASGLAGDAIVDTKNHGGPDQAVYVFGQPDYEWWRGELGRELSPGAFGENLTVDGLRSEALSIGDRLGVGGALLEVTAPRIPCATLGASMGDPTLVKRFRYAERPGVYCRVIRAGEVRAGDPVVHEPFAGERVPVLEVFRAFFEPDPDPALLRRHLSVPVAARARAMDEELLRRSSERARSSF